MAELVCYRQLWTTVSAAFTTLGVYVVANWSLPAFMSHSKSEKVLVWIVFVIGMPLFALYESLQNAMHVWLVRSWGVKKPADMQGDDDGMQGADHPFVDMQGDDDGMQGADHPFVDIITLCPIYIKTPSGVPNSELGEYVRCYKTLPPQQFEKMDPLELKARGDQQEHAGTSKFSELPHTSTLELMEDNDITTSLGERVALLASGLVPINELLGSLRLRNRFQTVVTLFQMCGYILTVIARILQGLAVSPLEAMLTFISGVVLLQMIVGLYVCGNYERPLLLRLTHSQLSRLCDEDRPVNLTVYFTRYHLVIYLSIWLSVIVLILAVSVHYTFHYYHLVGLVCSLSAMLFCLSVTVFAIIFMTPPFLHRRSPTRVIILLFSNVFFFLSLITASISTITDWEAFEEPGNWFAWLLRHLSG